MRSSQERQTFDFEKKKSYSEPGTLCEHPIMNTFKTVSFDFLDSFLGFLKKWIKKPLWLGLL